MVNLTIEEWQRQSSLLLQARPTTTRITTKYNVPNLESARYQKPRKRKRDAESEEQDAASSAPKVPKATLVLKTFDPASGVVLKFKTDKAADVGRLTNNLARLARHMAALPGKVEDVVAHDTPAAVVKEDEVETTNAATPADKPQQQASGKKKKKGKK